MPTFKSPERGTPGFASHQIEAFGSMLWTCSFMSHISTSISASYGTGRPAAWTIVLTVLPCFLAGLPGVLEGRPGSAGVLAIYGAYTVIPQVIVLLYGTLLMRTLATALILVPIGTSLVPTTLSATGSVSAWGSLTGALVALNAFTVLRPLSVPVGFTFRGNGDVVLILILKIFGLAIISAVSGLFASSATGFASYEAPKKVSPGRELAICVGLYLNALCEEVMYRGVLLNILLEWFPTQEFVAVIIASGLFGLAHLRRDKHGFRAPNWRYAVTATTYGFACALAWNISKRVTLSAFVHAAFNYAMRALIKKTSVE